MHAVNKLKSQKGNENCSAPITSFCVEDGCMLELLYKVLLYFVFCFFKYLLEEKIVADLHLLIFNVTSR